MIKILKEGSVKKNETYTCECYMCKTIFTYQDSDTKADPRGERYVICPLPDCKAFNSTK